ncbi:hypothetical protein [Streptomyces alkaliterrae]|uniref:Uncharacterized protein n=1 Tax=Streptomyces alkaliterrae TaxID=2213162 RepID=A0A7W3ZSV0_9ACTN|nr:hypothetical protein [Streptomyces alkaliterrae]MBB1259166.1 hypothetical protein [Streptomyces alkaliterrae]
MSGAVFAALPEGNAPLAPDATGTLYRLFPGPLDATGLRRAAAGDLVAELARSTTAGAGVGRGP